VGTITPAHEKAGVLSFVIDGIRAEDIGKALDQEGIAVRAGHHCAQPILRRFGGGKHRPGVARALQHLRGYR
jgi:selenocysteine lyase/cysteine desulfurase